ncbi:capsular polysaccharide export protein, LipB/KpsS family [Kushneria phyllosphaerae]|uniref:Capsule polysaccharide biosynthesis protein n=1 Tax=Kushneria phyllosphaerae TaxID=2100822 RepID=A0A2R8CNB2_9GAMM|nr:hypothetical protein [Kushneria phyllosphaerae]SPJ34388.1 hypothetical protein KSP9073_02422 [Kushneria phyllosphaerae]
MNFLVLSNGAPKYHRFFNGFSKKLKSDGHNVFYAVDSHVSLDENEVLDNEVEYKVFSDYFSRHEIDEAMLREYGEYNINYALLSDHDRSVEYGIWGERSNEFYEKLKSALLCYFSEIIVEQKIDVVLYENVSNSFAYFCWLVCQEHRVKYVGLTGNRLPGRFWITDNPLKEHEPVQAVFEKIRNGRVEVPEEVAEWCRDYLSNIESISPDYMKFNNLDNVSISGKYFKKDKLEKFVSGVRHVNDDHYHSYQRGNPLLFSWSLFTRSVKRKMKIRRVTSMYDQPDSGDQFILYPLHFHPESSTSILSGSYLNEYEVIRNVAFNLPQGIKLYVKDHMSAFGFPSLKFYRQLKGLPNVKLLPPDAPTKKLIKSSRAVITLTSTVGYEALLLGKQVFLFGEVFYQFHEDVIKIENPAKLHELLYEALANKKNEASSYQYTIDFLAAYYLSTLPGSLNLMMDDNQQAGALVDQLYPHVMDYIDRAVS